MPDLDSDQDALLPGEEFVFLLDSGQQPPPASQSVPVNDIRCDGKPYKMSTLDLCQDVSDLGSKPKQDLSTLATSNLHRQVQILGSKMMIKVSSIIYSILEMMGQIIHSHLATHHSPREWISNV